MRLASPFLYVIIGAVIGLLVGRLTMIPIVIFLPVNRAWMRGVSEFGAFLSIVSAVGRWMAKFGRRPAGPRVHGSARSARFASPEEVRAILARPSAGPS